MRLVVTVLARDEADVIDAQISFHLNAGADFVIATDNNSRDGTTDILESYARAGVLHLIREPAEGLRQGEWVTRMARLAATEHNADWVINSDADEFWWPRGGTLKDILGAVPPRFGSVRGMWRNFVARPEDGRPFAERMTIRSQRPVQGLHPFNTHFKTLHRGSHDVEIGGGNHDVQGSGVAPLYGWYPIDVLHFPIRTLEQFERKFIRHWHVTSADGKASNPFYDVVRDAQLAGRIDDLYRTFSVDDTQLERGLTDGSLAEDTRMRDALRSLRGSGSLSLDQASSTVDHGYLVELGYIEDNSGFVRAQRRLEALEARTSELETGIAQRLSRRIARLVWL